MTTSLLLGILLRVTVVLGAALIVAGTLRRGAASTRHVVLVAGQAAALIMPLLMLLVPRLEVGIPWTAEMNPTAVTSVREHSQPEPRIEDDLSATGLSFPSLGRLGVLAWVA